MESLAPWPIIAVLTVGFVAGFLLLRALSPASRLRHQIHRIKLRVRKVVRKRVPGAHATSIGAVEIDPKHLAIWVWVETDEQRDALRDDDDLIDQFRRILSDEHYPATAVSDVGFEFESDETVRRDYAGNWWHAMK